MQQSIERPGADLNLLSEQKNLEKDEKMKLFLPEIVLVLMLRAGWQNLREVGRIQKTVWQYIESVGIVYYCRIAALQ